MVAVGQWAVDSGHCSTVLGSIENCESKDYRNVLESKGWSSGSGGIVQLSMILNQITGM